MNFMPIVLLFLSFIATAGVNEVNYVVDYDQNQLLQTVRVLNSSSSAENEFAAQCIAVEMLRNLLASGMSVDDYNNMSAEDWENRKALAVTAASLNVVATEVNHLNDTQKESAANIGGNYFEHGYLFILSNVQQNERLSFRKLSGMSP